MSNIAPDGPFKVELKIAISNGDNVGEISYELPPGVIPTAESIAIALRRSADLPELEAGAFHLMDRHEFVEELLFERSGQRGFAISGPNEFSIAYSAEVES